MHMLCTSKDGQRVHVLFRSSESIMSQFGSTCHKVHNLVPFTYKLCKLKIFLFCLSFVSGRSKFSCTQANSTTLQKENVSWRNDEPDLAHWGLIYFKFFLREMSFAKKMHQNVAEMALWSTGNYLPGSMCTLNKQSKLKTYLTKIPSYGSVWLLRKFKIISSWP